MHFLMYVSYWYLQILLNFFISVWFWQSVWWMELSWAFGYTWYNAIIMHTGTFHSIMGILWHTEEKIFFEIWARLLHQKLTNSLVQQSLEINSTRLHFVVTKSAVMCITYWGEIAGRQRLQKWPNTFHLSCHRCYFHSGPWRQSQELYDLQCSTVCGKTHLPSQKIWILDCPMESFDRVAWFMCESHCKACFIPFITWAFIIKKCSFSVKGMFTATS